MTTKIAVSLPDDLVDEARASVGRGEFASVSAYVARALRRFGREDSLADLLAEWDEELGPVDEESKAWARKVLGLAE